MPLWDELPEDLRTSGALDGLKPVLDNVATPTSSEKTDPDGTWRVYRTSLGGNEPLRLDPASGAFERGTFGSSDANSLIEFPDPSVELELGLRLNAAGGTPDGTVRLIVETPSLLVRLPFLRGAKLDDVGQLKTDPAHPDVRFVLPALRLRFLRPNNAGLSVDLLSASTTGPLVEQVFEFVRMEPPYALIGPGDVFGFAFRSAVLDLSGSAGPSGVPSEARAMPGAWQGFYLPEARIFVAPNGLSGLAVSAGVRDLWIGFGRHAGVTGIFEAEVVNRGSAPVLRIRFQTPSGEWIGLADGGPATVELPESVTVIADAGGGLAPYRFTFKVGQDRFENRDRLPLTVPDDQTVNLEVSVNDALQHTTTRNFSVRRRAALPGTPANGAQPVGITPTSNNGSRIVIVTQTASHANVRLEPEGGDITWSWPGGTASGVTAQVPVAAGGTVAVTARRVRAPGSAMTLDAYTLFDRPEVQEGAAFADNPVNLHTAPANNRTGWGASPELVNDDFRARLAALAPGTTWTVEGWASFEGDDRPSKQRYNVDLSARRRDALVRVLEGNGFAGRVTAGAAHGHGPALASANPGSPEWWHAKATSTLTGGEDTTTATLNRPALPAETTSSDPQPSRTPVPDCFRKIGLRVEIVRNTFVRAELYGEFDVQTAAEQRLQTTGNNLPPRRNPQDGICLFLLRLRIAEDRASWDVKAEFRAASGDLDGLAKFEATGSDPDTGLNILGAVSVLAPLLAAVTPASPKDGELVPLLLATGAVVAIGGSGQLITKSVVLRGGELLITDGLVNPTDGTGPRGTNVSVMLDLETAFTFDLGFIRVKPNKPIITRYQAVGLQSRWESRPRTDGSIEYVPLPVFDPSRGYALDVPAGSLLATDPFGDLLRVLGVRVSRDNPTYLEVEVGMGVDLGILKLDTVRVRMRLDASETPQLTKLGATLDVPGTLHGSGYVEVTSSGFKGAFDLTVLPLNLRASAQLAVETKNGVTGVLVGAEVQFPLPLPLGTSGLALFGFLGGIGVNYTRLEQSGVQAPALKWLEAQLSSARNSVMHPDGWTHSAGHYAFAAGLLLGTAEGGFVIHLKGIVLIEVPGPRLLLVMKADVLKMPPVLKGQSNATFLAMLDLDFGRGTITIGVVAEFTVVDLLKIRVPVTAFFNTRQPAEWFVDLGSFTEPVTIKILDVFSGSGYLMIHGNGISHPRLPLVSSGLTIAVGFHLQAVLMGSKSVGLYLEVAAGFDALVSFEPFAIGGLIYVRGELRLFVIGISASASLTVLVGKQRLADGREVDRTFVHGEVCGEVDLFFFSIKGCVSLTLGEGQPEEALAPPLVAGLKLVSRSPGLVEGSATDRAIDGVLADALAVGTPGELPSVPLDAVPVVLFESPMGVATGNVILGGIARGANGLAADPWIRRGERWWRYELTSVELGGPLLPATGLRPATWWTRGAPGDPQHGPALALLSWLPTPFSRAVPYGERLEEQVHHDWGWLCDPMAEPVPVLWTFDRQPFGTSATGWRLSALAWPDQPGAWRSAPPNANLLVRERWRSQDAQVDLMQGTDAARVIGDHVPCPDKHPKPVPGLHDWLKGAAQGFSNNAVPEGDAGLLAAAEMLVAGSTLADLAAIWNDQAWDPKGPRLKFNCEGRLLRSPTDDHDQPAPFGEADEIKLVQNAWDAQGFAPSPLADSLLLRLEDGLETIQVLLLVSERHLQDLRLHTRDGGQRLLSEHTFNGNDLVRGDRPLPGRWTDGDGPWANPIGRAGRVAAQLLTAEPTLMLMLISLELPAGTVEIELGYDRSQQKDAPFAAFYLLAVEASLTSERRRFDWDRSSRSSSRDALETSVRQDPDDHALLTPGATYTARIKWRAESLKQVARPPLPTQTLSGPEVVQEFQFQADPPKNAPTNLDPWILATTPTMGESGVFCAEPLRLALANQKVAALFDAYGFELRVRVRSASGRHPPEPVSQVPDEPFILPLELDGVFFKAAPEALRIMTPWQQKVTELLNTLDCTDGSGSSTHHSIVELPYALEPLTDYLMDVLAVPKGSPSNASGSRVFRVNFTTSRFATLEDLAHMIQGTTIEERLIANPSALTALPDAPTGAQMDAAFQQAGLGVPEVPRYPRVQVFWSPEAVPQPVAVLIEGSEALWRERSVPTVVAGPPDGADPGHQWWKAVRQPWLSPSATLVNPNDPPGVLNTRLVRGPGDTRALVLLASGARGRELRVDLTLAADSLAGSMARVVEAVQVLLAHAPWEEEDQ